MTRRTSGCRIASAGVLLLALLAPTLATGDAGVAPTTQRSAVNRAINAQVAAALKVAPATGVHVVELATGKEIYAYEADTPRILASNTKLVTTAAALDRLGPAFFIETPVLVRGEIRDGVLEGDLAVIGGGDPTISGRFTGGDPYGVFREWAETLRRQGIGRIAGDLILVHGAFDNQRVHPDWPDDQLDRWYEAPVSALSFDDNCLLVVVRPARPGRPATVETVPPLALLPIESSVVTSSRRRGQWVKIERDDRAAGPVIVTRGRIARRTESIDAWIAVTDPVRFFGLALRAAFEEEGLTIDGATRAAVVLPELGTPDSPWRRVLVRRMDLLTVLEVVNKRSQNFYAESVLKLLGAERCGEGSWEAGLRVVAEFLADIGLPATWTLADGSGMSRNNHFSARQLTTLLSFMFAHRWGREYVRSLPYSGEPELRWEKRLAKPPYAGNVLAKTGYLDGVSTLSGYAKARSGKLYVFSILMNRSRSGDQAKAAQDRIVRALIDQG